MTHLVISGAYKLSEKLKKTAAPVTKMQAVKFANYFIRYSPKSCIFNEFILTLFSVVFHPVSLGKGVPNRKKLTMRTLNIKYLITCYPSH